MTKDTILVADDEPGIRDFFERYIRMKFPETSVRTFKDGVSLKSELEKILKEGNPENVVGVITDNNMPGVEGREIIRNYAFKLKQYGIKIVLCSGRIREGNMEKETLENGAYACFEKPFPLNLLEGIVKEMLDYTSS